MLFNLIGSLGLFLLGMWLMTEGLKLAGGQALEKLLGKWTSSRKRGLAAGILITSLVQSSSAVTVATMGFVSAGLLTFERALWVVFGGNVGTTFTAWMVTFFGFSLKIDTFTFPLIGIGAALRIFSPYERGKALGMALAGFGLLFMGIDALKENFSQYANLIDIQTALSATSFDIPIALGIGFVMTLLTQSSSAAIAIILTAVASGVTDAYIAAVCVIGANIGTTSTAIISAIGASPHVKRLAWAHVIFNLITALVALIILPIFWPLVTGLAELLNVGGNLVMLLAIFHTCFNILGIILMLPIEKVLIRFLLSLYKKPPKKPEKQFQLDTNVVNIPDLAIRVMTNELKELVEATDNLALPTPDQAATSNEEIELILQRLKNTNEYISKALKSELTKQQGNLLALGLNVTYHLSYACEIFNETLEKNATISKSSIIMPSQLTDWFSMVNDYNHKIHHSDSILQQEELEELSDNYQSIKIQLLNAAVGERLHVSVVDNALYAASLSRRFIEQILHANSAYMKLQKPEPEESEPTEEIEHKDESDSDNTTENNTPENINTL